MSKFYKYLFIVALSLNFPSSLMSNEEEFSKWLLKLG